MHRCKSCGTVQLHPEAVLCVKCKKPKEMIKNCQRCGVDIIPSSNGLKRFCKDCSKQNNLEKAREAAAGRAKDKTVVVSCARCGISVTCKAQGRRKYCVECAAEVKRETSVSYNALNKNPDERQCLTCAEIVTGKAKYCKECSRHRGLTSRRASRQAGKMQYKPVEFTIVTSNDYLKPFARLEAEARSNKLSYGKMYAPVVTVGRVNP